MQAPRRPLERQKSSVERGRFVEPVAVDAVRPDIRALIMVNHSAINLANVRVSRSGGTCPGTNTGSPAENIGDRESAGRCATNREPRMRHT
ncbi:hypothetical protein KM043_007808 [Ampulex compressa]|nr:hypothetical protein KM043_007808 [Ampulex compressa]